jgi:tetratricopeptide (TPR) repeat protein
MVSRKAPKNEEAYEAYLEGVEALTVRRGNAIDSLQRAMRADPAYAGAYTGMAIVYMSAGMSQSEDPRIVWERAREYARQALELEPESGEAALVEAYVAAYADQNEGRAEERLRRALEASPGSVPLQLLAGQLLSRLGKFREAEEMLQRAVQADPAGVMGRQLLAQHYYLSRQYDFSKREAWRVIRIRPASGIGYGLMVPALWMKGDWRVALLVAGRAEAAGLSQPMVAMGLAYTYGRGGRMEEARRIVETMEQQARMGYVSPLQRAVAHMGLGDKERAVALLRECLRMGCVNPSMPRLDPVFDPLRGRADYEALLR